VDGQHVGSGIQGVEGVRLGRGCDDVVSGSDSEARGDIRLILTASCAEKTRQDVGLVWRGEDFLMTLA
jgi:hypothetical protein